MNAGAGISPYVDARLLGAQAPVAYQDQHVINIGVAIGDRGSSSGGRPEQSTARVKGTSVCCSSGLLLPAVCCRLLSSDDEMR